jgi:hypothetical protein
MIARMLVLVLFASAALAQPGAPLSPEASVPTLSPAAEVSLLTMLPGDEVYALFGHTAFRVRDPALGLGLDRTYNYGTFDFDQPYFIARFARGLLDYQLSVAPMERTVAEYRFLERPIIEQRLALPADARQDLFQFLETNYLPQRRAYRYDFFFDNCSTRPRDALERALGRRLDYGGYEPAGTTFRDLLQPYLEAAPLTDLGIDLGLGAPTDREATDREAMFLPLELMRAFDAASFDGQPLVASRDTLFWIDGAGMPDAAFDWPTLLAWLLAALGIAWTAAMWHRGPSRGLRRFDVALFGVVGLAGAVILWLWLGTEHAVTGPNANLLWAWPTHLAAAIVLARRNLRGAMWVYWALTSAVALVTLLAWSALPQALPPAALPLVLLLGVRAGTRAARRQPETLSSL